MIVHPLIQQSQREALDRQISLAGDFLGLTAEEYLALFILSGLTGGVAGAIAGYLFLWCIYWLFRFARGVEGMGFGDFKLLAALGAWLGWAALPQIVLIAAVTGATVGLIAMGSGRLRFEEPLPFGPFLALGGAITLFGGTPFFHLLGA